MDFENYKKKDEELKKELYERRLKLMMEFVDYNNPHKINDKITDHIGSIIITKIEYSWNSFFNDVPCAIYTGIEIKKDGTPKKNNPIRVVHQINLIHE